MVINVHHIIPGVLCLKCSDCRLVSLKLVISTQADVLVNVIADEKRDLKRASRVSAAIVKAAGPELQQVCCLVLLLGNAST